MLIEKLVSTGNAYLGRNYFLKTDYCISYGKRVIEYHGKTKSIILGKYWDYSPTTLRHIHKFFTATFFEGQHIFTPQIRKALKEGTLLINGIPYTIMQDNKME